MAEELINTFLTLFFVKVEKKKEGPIFCYLSSESSPATHSGRASEQPNSMMCL